MKRRSRLGVTLIEILIVLALVGLLMGAVVVGTGRVAGARLRHSSTMIVGAIKVGFSNSSATSKNVRLVMDFGESAIWLEQGDQPMLVQSKETSGTGGARAATVAEKQALEETSRIVKGITAPRTMFTEINPMGVAASSPGKGHKALESGIKLLSVQTAHDDKPRTDGRAYLYFWPGGQTERAVITLTLGDPKAVVADVDKDKQRVQDEKNAVTLVVSPLTGKVTIREGAVPFTLPEDEKAASEREDPGAF